MNKQTSFLQSQLSFDKKGKNSHYGHNSESAYLNQKHYDHLSESAPMRERVNGNESRHAHCRSRRKKRIDKRVWLPLFDGYGKRQKCRSYKYCKEEHKRNYLIVGKLRFYLRKHRFHIVESLYNKLNNISSV